MKNKAPIQMVWIGDSISRLEYLCMQSFLKNGHPVHLYSYNKIKNLPQDVLCMDANKIIPKEQIFLHRQSYAVFADLFRWKLLSLVGGYYCDTDVLCLRSFDFADDVVVGYESADSINCAVLKFPPNHPIVLDMLDSALNPNKIKPYDTRKLKRKKIIKQLTFNTQQIGWGENAGPPALTRVLNYMQGKYDIDIKNFTYFYPIHHGNWNALFDGTLKDETLYKNTYAVHLWNELLRRNGIDKNQPFHPDSLVEKYFSIYCPNYDQ